MRYSLKMLHFPAGDAQQAVKYMELRDEILIREINLRIIDIYIEALGMDERG